MQNQLQTLFAQHNYDYYNTGLTVIPSSQSVEMTRNATFTTIITGMGSSNFTYQWRHNGTIISGETNNTLIITTLSPDDTGIYNCTVINQYRDSDSSSASLTVTGMHRLSSN